MSVTYGVPYYTTTTTAVPYYTTTSGTTYSGGNLTYAHGPVSYPPPVPARKQTELEWLAGEVDKVCALAR